MGRKVFVSYKYGDTSVQDLNLYEETFLGKMKITTKVRHYVDKLAEILDKTDNIYKGEDDDESLTDFSDDHIASKLRDKIFDSTITIVFISRGMKSWLESQKNQWIPWEIAYSMRESTRNGITSSCNGVLAVVLPDENGSHEYCITHDAVCGCRSLNRNFLFTILKENMFNQKAPQTSVCSNGSTIYHGDSSYIESVKWEDFVKAPNQYLDKSIQIRDKKEDYVLTKTID